MRMAMQMELLPPSAAERALAAALERRQRARLTAWRRAQKEAAKGDGRGKHANSLDANEALALTRGQRYQDILAYLRDNGPATARQILAGLYPNRGDMNLVRPRLTELLDAGLICTTGDVRDATTGRMVMVVAVQEGGNRG